MSDERPVLADYRWHRPIPVPGPIRARIAAELGVNREPE